jgi:hypothetical protein
MVQWQHSGVAKRIKDLSELATYVHCCGEVLNLCIVDLSKEVAGVRNMFDVLSRLYSFIEASSKRHQTMPLIKILNPLSDTRWDCRTKAICAVLDNFGSLVSALEEIAENDKLNDHNANSLLKRMTDFSFLICLKLTLVNT